MFAKAGWEVRYPNMLSCFGDTDAAIAAYFHELEDGQGCDQNWFVGSLGGKNVLPTFTEAAPALLGFDESIASYCIGHPGDENPPKGWERGHPSWCVNSNINILAIFNGPYSLCANLKWQVCAAQGKLPGQRGQRIIKFARAPGNMPIADGPHPFGKCSGFKPKGCDYGYGTDDIYFLEICLYSFLCDNGADLFGLKVAAGFQCVLSQARFRLLRTLLMDFITDRSPVQNEAYLEGGMMRCKSWCSQYTCDQGD